MAEEKLVYTGITFTNGVNRRYLYSDSPETIRPTATPKVLASPANGYLTGTTFNANERLDFELYHHNEYGVEKKFGIVVQNDNSTSVTLTLHNRAINTVKGDQRKQQDMTAVLMVNYFNSAATTITIPAKSSRFVLEANVPTANLVYGKLSMTSNKGNVYVRVVYGDKSKAADYYFTLDKQVTAQPDFFSGQVNYIQKNATVDANSVKTFVLGEWPPKINGSDDRPFINHDEYEKVLSHKDGGNKVLGGNYGVIYQVKIKNLNGRRVKLAPDDFGTNEWRLCNRIVFRVGNTWYTSDTLDTSNPSVYMTLYNDTLTIVIPGGNAANLPFYIE